MDLMDCRNEIDKIDQQIVQLFEQRMDIAKKVAEYKKSIGKQVLDPAREQQKIEAVMALCCNDFNRHGVRELFTVRNDHGE